jgi:plasmid stabilization system protein ParE
LEYSFEHRDDVQADKYLMSSTRRSILFPPTRSWALSEIMRAKVTERMFVNQHAIYYKLTPTAIDIVRVVHGQMDPERHL